MISSRDLALWIGLFLAFGSTAPPSLADEACVDFKWDVSKERALFAGTPQVLPAGKDANSAPAVAPNRFYKVQLVHQNQVRFAVTPGKKAQSAAAFAGLANLKISAAGNYRVAVDLPLWIDVAWNGRLVPPQDFEGQRSCSAPHKIVEFDLAAVRPLVLQFSNAASESVLLTVTASSPRKF